MKAIIIILVCVLWLPFSWGLVEDRTIHIRLNIDDFQQFGFARNGIISSLKVTTMPPQENVSLYICTDKEYDLLNSYLDPDELNFCSNPTSYCEYGGDHRLEVTNYRVASKNRYHFVLVQCGPKEPPAKARVQYTLLNPGGEQLPLGEIPLPKLYILVTCVWAILVGVCGIVWMRNKEHVVLLHGLLCSVAVFKLAVVMIALCYWHIYQITGEDIVQLKYLQSFIYALSETAFFCSLLLISKGWRITRSNLPPSEIRTISVALVLLLSTLLFFSFYNDGYYFLSLMIMYFFMLPKIFTSITRNTRALHTHMLLARYANVELNTIPILAKIRMFKALRTAVILYLGSILIISSMKIIMWWFLEWVTSCVSELVTIVMVVSVCLLTRPRLNGVFSPRSYFESGSFPVLNMQQFDHFDELFGDQIWDPDLVFGGNPNSNSNSNFPPSLPAIDLSEALVIEFPVPLLSKDISYFPRLAIATLEKDKKDNDNNNNDNNNNRMNLRRRTTSSSSSSSLSPSLANSTSALLPGSERSSLSLSSLSSNSPLLLSPPSLPSFSDLDIELEVLDNSDNNYNNYNNKNNNNNKEDNNNDIELELRSQSTQTSPPPTPTPTSSSPLTIKTIINTKQNTKQNIKHNNTTTTTTTTTTSSTPPNNTFLIESEKYNNKDKENTTVNNKPIKNTNINNDNNNKNTNCNTTTKHNNNSDNNNNSNNKQRTKGNIPLCNSSSSLLADGGEIEGEDELM